ncbi:pogo transposable element with krab domain [Plakobranchus ocellatus]|uniref:Pogo transposable element with krab domain n=1 Tax=Plakobranchus ocellatus TaxID=259542 RepID=A0AAV4A4A4_9GAST|nr:pogo transposable element with krab domain [Plakobranchus ocellatus]
METPRREGQSIAQGRLFENLVQPPVEPSALRQGNVDTEEGQGQVCHIREIWDLFDANLSKHYHPDQNITIDEQLVPFRGRCGFSQYIPSRPDKYVIMPRVYQRKHADFGKTPSDVMQLAIDDVSNGKPLRAAAKEYGIPRGTLRNNPLDRTVFGPLKAAYNRNADSWMLQNPGKTITIYQLAQFGGDAFLRAATHSNITSGFRVSGMWPLDVFDSEEYLPSDVTDRQLPGEPSGQAKSSGLTALPVLPPSSQSSDDSARAQTQTELPAQDDPSSASVQEAPTPPPVPSVKLTSYVSPADLRCYAKAPSRKESSRGQKRGKSMVATSTPEIKRIKEEALKKMQKTQKSQAAVSSRRLTFDVEDDDSASDISLTDLMDESKDVPERDAIKLGVVENVSVNDYVLCEFAKKAHKFYYVGQVTKENYSDDDVGLSEAQGQLFCLTSS